MGGDRHRGATAEKLKVILEIDRTVGIIPDPADSSTAEMLVLEAIHLQDLVICEIISSFHLFDTSLGCVVCSFPTWFAPDEMSHKGPPVVAKAGVILLDHFFILIHQNHPISMQVIRALQEHFVAPFGSLCDEQIDHGRLIVRFELRPPI